MSKMKFSQPVIYDEQQWKYDWTYQGLVAEENSEVELVPESMETETETLTHRELIGTAYQIVNNSLTEKRLQLLDLKAEIEELTRRSVGLECAMRLRTQPIRERETIVERETSLIQRLRHGVYTL